MFAQKTSFKFSFSFRLSPLTYMLSVELILTYLAPLFSYQVAASQKMLFELKRTTMQEMLSAEPFSRANLTIFCAITLVL